MAKKTHFKLQHPDGRTFNIHNSLKETAKHLMANGDHAGLEKLAMENHAPEAKSGIHIKESKKGTFTAAAKKRGKGVQEFASQVLAHKENYSTAMVKKANFAKNAAKWKHEYGGYVEPRQEAETLLDVDKAKDGKWIQKAVNPKHKGYCTPMTKKTCTPRRKALARTFKKHHGFHKAEDGMQMQEQQPQQQQQPMVAQGTPQQGGMQQMEQIAAMVAQALQQGADPQQVMQMLVQQGVPPQVAQQVIAQVMQQLQGAQQEQPQQEQMPQQQVPVQETPQGAYGMRIKKAQLGAGFNPAENALEQSGVSTEIPKKDFGMSMPVGLNTRQQAQFMSTAPLQKQDITTPALPKMDYSNLYSNLPQGEGSKENSQFKLPPSYYGYRGIGLPGYTGRAVQEGVENKYYRNMAKQTTDPTLKKQYEGMAKATGFTTGAAAAGAVFNEMIPSIADYFSGRQQYANQLKDVRAHENLMKQLSYEDSLANSRGGYQGGPAVSKYGRKLPCKSCGGRMELGGKLGFISAENSAQIPTGLNTRQKAQWISNLPLEKNEINIPTHGLDFASKRPNVNAEGGGKYSEGEVIAETGTQTVTNLNGAPTHDQQDNGASKVNLALNGGSVVMPRHLTDSLSGFIERFRNNPTIVNALLKTYGEGVAMAANGTMIGKGTDMDPQISWAAVADLVGNTKQEAMQEKELALQQEAIQRSMKKPMKVIKNLKPYLGNPVDTNIASTTDKLNVRFSEDNLNNSASELEDIQKEIDQLRKIREAKTALITDVMYPKLNEAVMSGQYGPEVKADYMKNNGAKFGKKIVKAQVSAEITDPSGETSQTSTTATQQSANVAPTTTSFNPYKTILGIEKGQGFSTGFTGASSKNHPEILEKYPNALNDEAEAQKAYDEFYAPQVEGLPDPLKLVAGDHAFNSENPWPSLVVTANLPNRDVNWKKGLYTKENKTDLTGYQVSNEDRQAVIDAYNKDPKGFLDRFAEERNRSNAGNMGATPESLKLQQARVAYTTEEAKKLLGQTSKQITTQQPTTTTTSTPANQTTTDLVMPTPQEYYRLGNMLYKGGSPYSEQVTLRGYKKGFNAAAQAGLTDSKKLVDYLLGLGFRPKNGWGNVTEQELQDFVYDLDDQKYQGKIKERLYNTYLPTIQGKNYFKSIGYDRIPQWHELTKEQRDKVFKDRIPGVRFAETLGYLQELNAPQGATQEAQSEVKTAYEPKDYSPSYKPGKKMILPRYRESISPANLAGLLPDLLARRKPGMAAYDTGAEMALASQVLPVDYNVAAQIAEQYRALKGASPRLKTTDPVAMANQAAMLAGTQANINKIMEDAANRNVQGFEQYQSQKGNLKLALGKAFQEFKQRGMDTSAASEAAWDAVINRGAKGYAKAQAKVDMENRRLANLYGMFPNIGYSPLIGEVYQGNWTPTVGGTYAGASNQEATKAENMRLRNQLLTLQALAAQGKLSSSPLYSQDLYGEDLASDKMGGKVKTKLPKKSLKRMKKVNLL